MNTKESPVLRTPGHESPYQSNLELDFTRCTGCRCGWPGLPSESCPACRLPLLSRHWPMEQLIEMVLP